MFTWKLVCISFIGYFGDKKKSKMQECKSASTESAKQNLLRKIINPIFCTSLSTTKLWSGVRYCDVVASSQESDGWILLKCKRKLD